MTYAGINCQNTHISLSAPSVGLLEGERRLLWTFPSNPLSPKVIKGSFLIGTSTLATVLADNLHTVQGSVPHIQLSVFLRLLINEHFLVE